MNEQLNEKQGNETGGNKENDVGNQRSAKHNKRQT